jgi:hypothetical protein
VRSDPFSPNTASVNGWRPKASLSSGSIKTSSASGRNRCPPVNVRTGELLGRGTKIGSSLRLSMTR